MVRKMIAWMFFTVIISILPLIFMIFICKIGSIEITYEQVLSEIFFLSIILSSDSIKTVYNVRDDDLGFWIHNASIVILIFASVIYGIMLYHTYVQKLSLDVEWIGNLSAIIGFLGLVSDFTAQIYEGIKNV